MPVPQLPNYLRTYRKRARLTQEEVGYILGSKSGAVISRHERSKQTPDLQTLLAYEMLFRTPVRNLFDGTHRKVEQKLLRRIRRLIRTLSEGEECRGAELKIEILRAYLEEKMAVRT
jgi:DNA-binding XRE family transcriptional regulator